ncbi:alpha/beta hydrolase [Nocardia sp. NPDC050406]|uniref:alpha/beta hydrolase n=1 Tax=Nocardia sp. NPDC050406 TaxID=3364318 RepID=UPI0037B840F2
MTSIEPLRTSDRRPRLVVEEFGPASRRTRVVTAVARPFIRTGLEVASIAARPWNVRAASWTDYVGGRYRPTPGVLRRPVRLADLDLEWVWPSSVPAPESAPAAVLYFHGGAFVAGGLRTFRGVGARISAATGWPVCTVGYRMLPTPVTAIVEDGVRAYRYLLSRGFDPRHIVCVGDSSGGYLAFAVPLAAREAGLPLPGGIIAASPWTDFDCAAKFRSPHGRTDVFFSAAAIDRLVRRLLVDEDGARPLSPVDAALTGLPPVLIQASTSELLRCDAELMAQRLADAKVSCRLQLWDRQPHGFPVFGALPESRAAIAEMARFLHDLTEPMETQENSCPESS